MIPPSQLYPWDPQFDAAFILIEVQYIMGLPEFVLMGQSNVQKCRDKEQFWMCIFSSLLFLRAYCFADKIQVQIYVLIFHYDHRTSGHM
jgi:hypothetical protein